MKTWQLNKSKSWSYQLNSTANFAHLAHFSGKYGLDKGEIKSKADWRARCAIDSPKK